MSDLDTMALTLHAKAFAIKQGTIVVSKAGINSIVGKVLSIVVNILLTF